MSVQRKKSSSEERKRKTQHKKGTVSLWHGHQGISWHVLIALHIFAPESGEALRSIHWPLPWCQRSSASCCCDYSPEGKGGYFVSGFSKTEYSPSCCGQSHLYSSVYVNYIKFTFLVNCEKIPIISILLKTNIFYRLTFCCCIMIIENNGMWTMREETEWGYGSLSTTDRWRTDRREGKAQRGSVMDEGQVAGGRLAYQGLLHDHLNNQITHKTLGTCSGIRWARPNLG